MAESLHETSPYTSPQPFIRNRLDREGCKDGARTIDRDNKILERKLHDIRRKPSACIPPPTPPSRASPSVSCSACSNSAPWESFKHHSQNLHNKSPGKSMQKQWQRQLELDNAIINKTLRECYSAKASALERQLGISSVDCNSMWQQRTSVYASASKTGTTSTSSRPSSAPAATSRAKQHRPISSGSLHSAAFREGGNRSTGVPKTLGVASCAGCGCRSFFNADGRALKPCTACGQVYYCSETCAKFDQPSHKALCRYYVTGHWTPAGTRPAADCWVVNRSMAVARKLLKQHHRSRGSTAAATAAAGVCGTGSSSCPGTVGWQSAGVEAHCASEDTDVTSAAARASHLARESLQAAQQLELKGQKVTKHGGQYYCSDAFDSTTNRQSVEHFQQGQQYHKQDRSYGIDSSWDQELAWQEQIEQRLAAVRLPEQQQEIAQQLLEQRANQGLDGPRPCNCVNGMEIIGGRKARPKSSFG